jgi:hypothetical protein
VLNRIEAFLDHLTGPAAPDGYLRDVKVVPFNAWHYAETNLWAGDAGRILAEVGDVARFATKDAFASYNGTAPIDVSSGDQVRHRLSRAGNRRINHALHMMAVTQASKSSTLAHGSAPTSSTKPKPTAKTGAS